MPRMLISPQRQGLLHILILHHQNCSEPLVNATMLPMCFHSGW